MSDGPPERSRAGLSGRLRAGSIVALVAALGLAGLLASAPPETVLVVEDATSGERLLETPVEEGTTVALEYTHSVERTPVRDVYVVHDGRLEMTRMEFRSYGWGLPAGANVTREGDDFVYEPDGVTPAVLTVKPGRIAGHELVVGDRSAGSDRRAADQYWSADQRRYDLVARSNASTVRIYLADGSWPTVSPREDSP